MSPNEMVVHRIELREGTADPSVLNLNSGESIGPIDVGTTGHWRITAAGVADRHAYLFFDGSRLYLQSVNADMPVLANGHAVPPSWVAVEPPCEIAIGGALLWFDQSNQDDVIDDEVSDEDTDNDPGAVATRVVPIEEIMERTAATRRAVLAQLLPQGMRAPTPPSGIPHLPPPSGRGRDDMETATSLFEVPEPRGSQPRSSQRGAMDMPPGSVPTPTEQLAPGSHPGDAPPPLPSRPSPFAPTDPAQEPMMPYRPDHLTTFGVDHASTGKSVAMRPSRWQRMSFPQKATAILFLPMVAAVVVIFTDVGGALKPQPRTKTSSSAAPSASAPPLATTTETSASDVPEDEPVTQPPEPVASTEPSATPPVRQDGPLADTEKEKDKTMQRKAVDALARGSYEEAAQIYDTLAKQHPENKAFAAAAAITRARMHK